MDQNQGLGEKQPLEPVHNDAPSLLWVTLSSVAWFRSYGGLLWAKTSRAYLVLAGVSLARLFVPANVGLMVGILVGLVVALATAMFAVSTHRVVLLGAAGVPDGGIISPTRRELKFVVYEWLMLITIGLLVMTPLSFGLTWLDGSPSSGVAVWVPLLMGGVSLALVIRLSFMFPAIALDQATGPSIAWYDSKGWFWSYGLACLLFMVIPWLAMVVLSLLPMTLLMSLDQHGYVVDAVVAVLSPIVVWLTVVPLSIAYGHATGLVGGDAAANPADSDV